MVKACQLAQVRLHQRLGLLPALRVGAPELAVDAVVDDVVLLGLQRLAREAGLLVDLDHACLQLRRLLVQRLAVREQAERVGRVLGALLADVQLAELLVHAEFVRPPRVRVDVGGDRLGPQPGRVSRVDPCPCVSASGSPKEVDILRQDDQLAAAAHQPARTYSPGVSRAAMSRRSAAAEPDRDSPQIGHRT